VERTPIDGIELEYEVRGTGEPIVLIHAGVCAEFFAPPGPGVGAHRDYAPSGTTEPATRAAAVCKARSASRCAAVRRVALRRPWRDGPLVSLSPESASSSGLASGSLEGLDDGEEGSG
jgi:hypothetical protein